MAFEWEQRDRVVFNPEGSGYDYETAKAYGISADETGHWPSRVPQTGQILKGRKHPTYSKTIAGEKEAGYTIQRGLDNKYYSARPWEQQDQIVEPAWEQRDPIRFGEAFVQDAETKAPFSPIGAFEIADVVLSSRRLKNNLYDEAPIFRAAGDTDRATKALGGSFGGISMFKPQWTPERQREQDVQVVTDFLREQNERAERGYTTMGRVGQITSEMPAFVTEFLMTGGLATLGKTGGKKLAVKALRKHASTTAGKAAIATSGFAAGAGLRAAGMPHRAANAILRRQAPQHIDVRDDGQVIIEGPVEDTFTSIWKGLADHYIEIASEQAGEYFVPAFSKIAGKMPFMSKLVNKIKPRWLTLNPLKKASDFTKKIGTKTGFHGVLSEVGEEFLGDATRALVDVEHFGAGEEANAAERLSAAVIADIDNLPAMLISFTIPGVVTAGMNSRIQKRNDLDKKLKDQVRYVAQVNESVPTEIDTAEGILGFESDFPLEDIEARKAKYDFDTPGIPEYIGFTPKWLINRILGVETLLKDVTSAEMSLQLEQQHLGSWINRITKKLKKEKALVRLPDLLEAEAVKESTTVVQEPEGLETAGGFLGIEEDFSVIQSDVRDTKAHVLQTKLDSKKPMHIMRDLLDTYENAPSFLNENETNIFNQVRELTRYLRMRANLVREKMGLEPIADVKGYITHWMDRAANMVVNKDLPIHYGFLYKLMRGLPKKIVNKTALKRKVKGQMEQYFSKDLGKLLRVMTTFDLKDIHLMQPYQAAWDELQELREARAIPDSTYRMVENFMLYDIRKHAAPMDKAFNKTMKIPVDFINRLLSVKNVIDDPARKVFSTMRRMGLVSGLGFRLKPGGRNLGQRLLLTDLYRTVDYAKAQAVAFRMSDMPVVKHPITGEPIQIIELIREQDWYKLALRKFEDLNTVVTGVEKSALALYGKTHIGNLFLSNVEVAALTGYFDWEQMYRKSKDVTSSHYKAVVRESAKLKVPVVDLLTSESDLNWNMREAVRRTQWEYFSISMPALYRSQFNRTMFMFQSWWMNYFFNHSREAINQTMTGRNSLGRLLTPGGRLRAVKGLGTIVAIGKASKALFGIEMLKYLILPFPNYLPPVPELIGGIIGVLAADDERERAKALKRLKYGLKFWIPFSAFGRDLNKLLSGEYSIGDFLFYRPKDK